MIRRALIYIAIGVIGSWLTTSAALWELDPGQWSEMARMLTVYVSAPSFALAAFCLGELS